MNVCMYVWIDVCLYVCTCMQSRLQKGVSMSTYPTKPGLLIRLYVPKSQREIQALDIVKIAGTQARTRQGTDDNR